MYCSKTFFFNTSGFFVFSPTIFLSICCSFNIHIQSSFKKNPGPVFFFILPPSPLYSFSFLLSLFLLLWNPIFFYSYPVSTFFPLFLLTVIPFFLFLISSKHQICHVLFLLLCRFFFSFFFFPTYQLAVSLWQYPFIHFYFLTGNRNKYYQINFEFFFA